MLIVLIKYDKYHILLRWHFITFVITKKKSEMNIIFMLIIVSLFIAIIFFILFIKSVKTGQFDDVYTPSIRMLFDDELVKPDSSDNDKNNSKS